MLEYMEPWPGKINFSQLQAAGELPPRYREILAPLKPIATETRIDRGCVEVVGEISPQEKATIHQVALQLKNWKKGPFNLFGISIDSEWRSDLKWRRLRQQVGSLTGQVVLDIGCNNGYFMYRMAEAGAKEILGIDPTGHFKAQFELIQSFARTPGLHFELFGIEQLSAFHGVFDTVFSMGILYHHPHPLQQLQDIYGVLKSGGKLVLETIGIAGDGPTALCPPNRYAQMKNIWFLPTLPTLLHWMKRAQFQQVEVISTEWGGEQEQRSTPWSAPVSYRDFLHPNNPQLTIEGHPAPQRFIVSGVKG